MSLNDVKIKWEHFAKTDPLWAIEANDDKYGNKWQPDDFFLTGRKYVDSLMQYIQMFGISIPIKKALDFGCGVGRVTQALSDSFDAVSGVDISPTMIKLANEYNRFPEKCKYFVNDKNDLALFSDNTFDLVHSVIVLQHMKPELSKNYILEFLRVVSPGGLVIFQQPSEILAYKWPNRLIYRTLDEIKKVLGKKSRTLDMYGIRRKKLEKLLVSSGGTIIAVKEDRLAGSLWRSYTYFVRK